MQPVLEMVLFELYIMSLRWLLLGLRRKDW
jgi:hypothetical protein